MHFSSLAVVALSTLLIGSADAAIRGQATSFTALEPVESELCEGMFYDQEELVVKLSNLNDVPCNATIAVLDPEFGTGIYGVRVVDTCVGCGENNIVLSALAFADLGGYLSIGAKSLDVEWYVEG